jgi:putative ABC transport system permease protein
VSILGKSFYLKLAAGNLVRNQKKTVPYFIAATIMICVYFMVLMIIYSPGLADVPGSGYLKEMFKIGFFVLNIFITIFMLYINSFLIKQRKKELGLYGILGLEKRHVGHVMLWENLFLNGSALALGITSGCIFGWLLFMLLLKSINVTKHTYFTLPPKAFLITFIYFLILFLIVSFLNILQVRMANPIDLLKSDHQGEKKARFLIPITALGVIALGYAYYIAVNVVNPLQALSKFFFAVVLVILATFALFTSGSIALLKFLKNRKKFYYKPDNFISIAGMIHRMKQNASGLASICILSTMVLVTVSTCIALYIGQEDTLKIRNKDDIQLVIDEDIKEDRYSKMDGLFRKAAEETGVTIQNCYRYYSADGMFVFQDGEFKEPKKDIQYLERVSKDAVSVSFLPLSDFNRTCNENLTLLDNQVIFWQMKESM